MFCFTACFPKFIHGIFMGNGQFWGFSSAGLVREHLSSLEFALEGLFVMPLKFLYSCFYIVGFFFPNKRLWGRQHLLCLLFYWPSSWICQIVKVFLVIIVFISTPVALHFEFPLHNFIKVVVGFIGVSSDLLSCIRQCIPLRFYSLFCIQILR